MKQSNKKGFTLLELLIVIAIIAVLSVILILVLNPAETLKKSRDAQRISDLNTLKTALGLYVTATTSPQLDNTSGNTLCVGGSGSDSLWFSVPTAVVTIGSAPSGFTAVQRATNDAASGVSGSGWVPVNLSSLTGGSPISNMPLDPTNTATATPNQTALMYRYGCDASSLTFEIDARLESDAYTVDDNKGAKDGGNNSKLYEVGTKLTVLPATEDF